MARSATTLKLEGVCVYPCTLTPPICFFVVVPVMVLFSGVIGGERLERPDGCPAAVYAIMQQCWSASPRDRPTFVRYRHVYEHVYRCIHVHSHVCRHACSHLYVHGMNRHIGADRWRDMRGDMCIDMCIELLTDTCVKLRSYIGTDCAICSPKCTQEAPAVTQALVHKTWGIPNSQKELSSAKVGVNHTFFR